MYKSIQTRISLVLFALGIKVLLVLTPALSYSVVTYINNDKKKRIKNKNGHGLSIAFHDAHFQKERQRRTSIPLLINGNDELTITDQDHELSEATSAHHEEKNRGKKKAIIDHMKSGTGNVLVERRTFLKRDIPSAFAKTIFFPCVMMTTGLQPSWCAQQQQQPRVKGAAEYDFEYYMRDLLNGNQPQGNQPASQPPPSYIRPPRILKGFLIDDTKFPLLDKDCSYNCIVVQELIKVAEQQQQGTTTNKADLISQLTQTYRTRALRNGYGSYKVYQNENMSDEYYFDVTSYSLWKIASSDVVLGTGSTTNYKARDMFIRNVGRRIYEQLLTQPKQFIKIPSKDQIQSSPLTSMIPALTDILNFFQESNFISSYRLGPKENVKNQQPLFDMYDDEDFLNGITINALVSVFEPVTLSSSLQITGEGSRFIPDFIGCTLEAAFEDILIKKSTSSPLLKNVSIETYFVDSVYRPNPKDYFPDEQLFQFTLTPK